MCIVYQSFITVVFIKIELTINCLNCLKNKYVWCTTCKPPWEAQAILLSLYATICLLLTFLLELFHKLQQYNTSVWFEQNNLSCVEHLWNFLVNTLFLQYYPYISIWWGFCNIFTLYSRTLQKKSRLAKRVTLDFKWINTMQYSASTEKEEVLSLPERRTFPSLN